jgi:hypothetical protein
VLPAIVDNAFADRPYIYASARFGRASSFG